MHLEGERVCHTRSKALSLHSLFYFQSKKYLFEKHRERKNIRAVFCGVLSMKVAKSFTKSLLIVELVGVVGGRELKLFLKKDFIEKKMIGNN